MQKGWSLQIFILLLLTGYPGGWIISNAGITRLNAQVFPPVKTLNEQADGYRGIWYANQASNDEYVYKYSGGLGTYCAMHQPFAVYRPEVDKTFFCYGGAARDDNLRLLHMVSCYDHRTGMVPRPTILLDKHTEDAHDNPVISVDDQGYVWIFSTSHGIDRPSFIHRSHRPYDVSEFERIPATRREENADVPFDNFSYMQAWHLADRGFFAFLTRYDASYQYDRSHQLPAKRISYYMSSRDGRTWSPMQRLAQIEEGHYQISVASENRIGSAFNMHPDGKGLNWRTNLYYVESTDRFASWHAADGTPVTLPLVDRYNPALIHDYAAENLNVYVRDILLDEGGQPVILYILSKGYEAGPKNDPRTWTTARWTGSQWIIRPAVRSDSNYDMGSLYIEQDGTWRFIGPIEAGPQPYNPGGEIVMVTSSDQGATWVRARQLTSASAFNHTYVRRPVNAHPDFYALWADGHGRRPSESCLYFCNKNGDVFRLPRNMAKAFVLPERLPAP